MNRRRFLKTLSASAMVPANVKIGNLTVQHLDDFILMTFPRDEPPLPNEVVALRDRMAKMNLSRPVLIWWRELDVKEMSHEEMVALRKTLDEVLG